MRQLHLSIHSQTVRAANLPSVDISLAAVDDSYNAEPHGYNSATQYVYGVGAMVHEIKIGDHCQRSSA